MDIEIGKKYYFDFPFKGLPESSPDHAAHRDQLVTVIHRSSYLTDSETVYQIRATDGWVGAAFEGELVHPAHWGKKN